MYSNDAVSVASRESAGSGLRAGIGWPAIPCKVGVVPAVVLLRVAARLGARPVACQRLMTRLLENRIHPVEPSYNYYSD